MTELLAVSNLGKRFGGFVALEMANQMPDGREIFELRRLGFPFLHFALAEMAHSRLERLADTLHRECLGDAD